MIEEHSPPDKQIPLIIDNYSAHKLDYLGATLQDF